MDQLDFDSKNSLHNVFLRIYGHTEIQDRPSFAEFGQELESVYNDLLRYGVFLRDVRGKSQRGAVVPRLYLRRLLLPTFRLTPSQRDNVTMEAEDFLLLLASPREFQSDFQKRPKDSGQQPSLFPD